MSAARNGSPVCNNASRVTVSPSLQRELEEFTVRVGATCGVDLPVRDFTGLPVGDLRKYCGALLEGCGQHHWAPILRMLPAQDRLSIAGSLFSFRKSLPTDDPCVDTYVQRMCTGSSPPPPGYLRFVRRELKGMFRIGWDKGWRRFVASTAPSSSGSLVTPRKDGGARSDLVGSRGWFFRACNGLERNLNLSTNRKVCVAKKDGKARLVSSSPAETVVLSPLHAMLYEHISRKEWLLRGEADPAKFQNFTRRDGEVFVSGDYESATDNLNLEVTMTILGEVLSRCSYVPLPVRRVAMESLRCVLSGPGFTGLQQRGQLMGNFLSFPLLCLQNYLAFRFLIRRRVPVKINGDDIVFRATTTERDRWVKGVGELGFKLSVSKTFIHTRFFSVNSTYFKSRVKGVDLVPIVRSTFFSRPLEELSSLSGRLKAVGAGWGEEVASTLRIALLRKHQRTIRCGQRSLRRGLGCVLTDTEIFKGGFGPWESHYSNLPFESRAPSKIAVSGALPSGWKRCYPRLGDLVQDDGFDRACRSHAWQVSVKRVSSDTYWSAVRAGTSAFEPRRSSWWRKRAKLLRLSVSEARRFLRPTLAKVPLCGKGVWVREGASRGELRFISGGVFAGLSEEGDG